MDSKEIDKLVNEIGGVIALYSCQDKPIKDITRLINAKRLLVGYCYRFSEVVGYALDEYNVSYSSRKNELAVKKLKYIDSGDSVSKAELKAELKSYELRLAEGESITQDISILRKEYEDSRIHNNG